MVLLSTVWVAKKRLMLSGVYSPASVFTFPQIECPNSHQMAQASQEPLQAGAEACLVCTNLSIAVPVQGKGKHRNHNPAWFMGCWEDPTMIYRPHSPNPGDSMQAEHFPLDITCSRLRTHLGWLLWPQAELQSWKANGTVLVAEVSRGLRIPGRALGKDSRRCGRRGPGTIQAYPKVSGGALDILFAPTFGITFLPRESCHPSLEPQGCDFPAHSFPSGLRETLQPESLLLGVAFAARPDQSSRATDCSSILPSTVQTRARHGRIPSRNCPLQEATQTGHPEEGSRDQGPGQGLGTCLARRRTWPSPRQQQLWGGPEHCQGTRVVPWTCLCLPWTGLIFGLSLDCRDLL